MRIPASVICLFSAILLPLNAHATLVSDGNFTAWSSFYFVTDDPYVAGGPPNVSSGSAIRVASGGNPGAFLQVTHTFTYGDTIWTGGIKTDYAYTPSTAGAITSLSVSADVKMSPIGSSAWQLVIEQSGQRYYSVPWNSFSNSTWSTVSSSNLTASNFDTNPWALNAGILPNGNHPNFSSTAAPIEFGFMFGNRVLNGGTYTNTLGLDNFSVNITSAVPEPEEWIMMLLGFGMVGWQVKRKPMKSAPSVA